jgi:hypothetical protein
MIIENTLYKALGLITQEKNYYHCFITSVSSARGQDRKITVQFLDGYTGHLPEHSFCSMFELDQEYYFYLQITGL